MVKERKKKQGSVFQRGYNGRWVGSYVVGKKIGKNGKEIPDRKYVYADSREEAEKLLCDMVYQIENDIREKEENKDKLHVFLDKWLWGVAKLYVRAKTFSGYEQTVRHYIVPHIGDIRLRELEVEHVIQMIVALKQQPKRQGTKRGLSPRTIELAKVVLGAALDDAVEKRLIEYNVVKTKAVRKAVARLVTDKKVQDRMDNVGKSMTIEEATRFMEKAREQKRYSELLMAQLVTACRPGEILGLRWECVRFDTNEIVINADLARTTEYDKDRNKTSIKALDGLKREASYRTLTVPGFMMDMLRELKLKQEAESKRTFTGKRQYIESDLVFTTRYGTPIEPRNYNRLFDKVKKEAGFDRYTPHSLRHTAIEIMKQKRFDYEVLQYFVGHSNPDVTGKYLSRLKNCVGEEIPKVEEVYKKILGIG